MSLNYLHSTNKNYLINNETITMIKLTNTQTTTLSNAAQRETLSIFPLPNNINKGIESRVILGLVKKEFIDEKNGDYIINSNGFKAIGLEPKKKIKTSKNDIILRLVSAEKGATLEALCEATSWQKHSVRGAISTLKSKGHNIASSKDSDGSRKYTLKKDNTPSILNSH